MFLKLVFFEIMKEMRYKHAGLLKNGHFREQNKLEGIKYNKSGGQNIHASKQVFGGAVA